MDKLAHALLEDAESFFSRGVRPDQHKASTLKRGQPVYEVRSHTGAAWRGGAIMDVQGDPWLVYADRHDQFHATAPTFFANPEPHYAPTAVDLTIRANEDEAAADDAADIALLEILVETLAAAVRSVPEPQVAAISSGGSSATLSIRIDLGTPAESPSLSHESLSDVTIEVQIDAHDHEFRQRIMRLYLPFVQPDANMREQVYTGDYSILILLLIVSQSRLAQVLVTADSEETPQPVCVPDPTRLHWVHSSGLVEAHVLGLPVAALCGTWFVPTREGNGLPICGACEQVQPVAQELLDLARQSTSQS